MSVSSVPTPGTTSPLLPRPAEDGDGRARTVVGEVRDVESQQIADLSTDSSEQLAGGTPRATSVATRRSAACSSASRATPARLSAFVIAIATSSVKEARRTSVSGGSRRSTVEPTTITPQS